MRKLMVRDSRRDDVDEARVLLEVALDLLGADDELLDELAAVLNKADELVRKHEER